MFAILKKKKKKKRPPRQAGGDIYQPVEKGRREIIILSGKSDRKRQVSYDIAYMGNLKK